MAGLDPWLQQTPGHLQLCKQGCCWEPTGHQLRAAYHLLPAVCTPAQDPGHQWWCWIYKKSGLLLSSGSSDFSFQRALMQGFNVFFVFRKTWCWGNSQVRCDLIPMMSKWHHWKDLVKQQVPYSSLISTTYEDPALSKAQLPTLPWGKCGIIQFWNLKKWHMPRELIMVVICVGMPRSRNKDPMQIGNT